MPPPLRQHIWIWAGLQLISVSWLLYPSPVTGLNLWQVFRFLPGVVFDEVHRFVAPPQPHSEVWTWLPPCSYPAYRTWYFRCSCIPGPYCCPECCHWVSLFLLHGNLGGLPPPETHPQSWLLMRWGQQGPSTHQLPFMLEKLCWPLLPYPMTVHMCIILPWNLFLWIHLHLSKIPLYLFYSSRFPPQLCLPSCPTPIFWTVTCPHLSAGLVSDVGGLMSSSVPPYYS